MSWTRHAGSLRPAQFRKLVCCLACGAELRRAYDLAEHHAHQAAPLWIRALRRRYKNRGGLAPFFGQKLNGCAVPTHTAAERAGEANGTD